jgi:hypothetical protein
MLILDGHESHVTPEFIHHCLFNNILLLRLPPHTSHILQPLNVGLFGPLKTALSNKLDPLIQTEVAHVQKCEWLLAYVHARIEAFTHSNILSGWRGVGLFPLDPEKALCQVPTAPSQPDPPAFEIPPGIDNPALDPNLFGQAFLTSSPPNSETLRQLSSALQIETAEPKVLSTPIHQCIPKLAFTTERLYAENSILKTRLKAATDVLSARRSAKKGKRIALKDQLLLMTEEIYKTVEALDKEAKGKRKKKTSWKRKQPSPKLDTASEGVSSTAGDDLHFPSEILDCTVVEHS